MNEETALVDEIVRRVLQQLPGVQLGLRSAVPAVPAAAARPASTTEEPSPGQMYAPPAHYEPAGAHSVSPLSVSPLSGTPVPASTQSVPTIADAGPKSAPQPAPAAEPPVRASPSGASPSTAATSPASPATAVPVAVAEVAVIAERIVTAEVLLRHLNGAQRVRVSAKALLTPSANDVVRSRKLAVVREHSPGRAGSGSSRRWLVLRTEPLVGLETALGNWRAAGTAVESRLAGDHAEGATQAISAICRGEADEVLLLTAEPEWLACLVNRNDKVRGAAVADAAAIGRLKGSLKPNVWTCSGAKRGAFELTSLFQALDR